MTLYQRVERATHRVLAGPRVSKVGPFVDLMSDVSPEEAFNAEYVRIEGSFSDRYAVLTYQDGVYRYFGGAQNVEAYEGSEHDARTVFSRDTATFDEAMSTIVSYFRDYGREAEMADAK